MIDFGMAVAELVLTRARPLFDERALPWPSAFAEVVANRLLDVLDLDAREWLR